MTLTRQPSPNSGVHGNFDICLHLIRTRNTKPFLREPVTILPLHLIFRLVYFVSVFHLFIFCSRKRRFRISILIFFFSRGFNAFAQVIYLTKVLLLWLGLVGWVRRIWTVPNFFLDPWLTSRGIEVRGVGRSTLFSLLALSLQWSWSRRCSRYLKDTSSGMERDVPSLLEIEAGSWNNESQSTLRASSTISSWPRCDWNHLSLTSSSESTSTSALGTFQPLLYPLLKPVAKNAWRLVPSQMNSSAPCLFSFFSLTRSSSSERSSWISSTAWRLWLEE